MSEKTLTYLLKNLAVNPITDLKAKAGPGEYLKVGSFNKYDTAEFTGGMPTNESGIAEYVYIYTPNQCMDGTVKTCKVHLHLHGCGGSYLEAGEAGMVYSGLMDFAVTNDLIIIFPNADLVTTTPTV